MTHQLQKVIDAVRALSPLEQLELMQILSQSLAQAYPHALNTAAFWTPRSIEDIARDQKTPVVTDISTLAVDFWPSDESTDDILAFIAEQRHTDRMRKV